MKPRLSMVDCHQGLLWAASPVKSDHGFQFCNPSVPAQSLPLPEPAHAGL